jgi:hypothetical protein
VKLPAYKAGLQNNIFIKANPIYIPLFGKEGSGEILKTLFLKSPFRLSESA